MSSLDMGLECLNTTHGSVCRRNFSISDEMLTTENEFHDVASELFTLINQTSQMISTVNNLSHINNTLNTYGATESMLALLNADGSFASALGINIPKLTKANKSSVTASMEAATEEAKKTLWQRIKVWFAKIIKKIKEFFEKYINVNKRRERYFTNGADKSYPCSSSKKGNIIDRKTFAELASSVQRILRNPEAYSAATISGANEVVFGKYSEDIKEATVTEAGWNESSIKRYCKEMAAAHKQLYITKEALKTAENAAKKALKEAQRAATKENAHEDAIAEANKQVEIANAALTTSIQVQTHTNKLGNVLMRIMSLASKK